MRLIHEITNKKTLTSERLFMLPCLECQIRLTLDYVQQVKFISYFQPLRFEDVQLIYPAHR